jgi:DNA/RNA endonuclease G (NUC1)
MTPAPPICFNGINGATGEYLLELSADEVAAIAAGEQPDPAHLSRLKFLDQLFAEQHLEVREGVDPDRLEEAGWGVVFPATADAAGKKAQAAVREALKPLLDLRREQAGRVNSRRYREFTGPAGYRSGERDDQFLARHGMGPGPADPDVVPYYLLVVGGPEDIPYAFQYQLDVQYAVGRLHFDAPDEYANYARAVVAAEAGTVSVARRAVFFGPRNPGDRATELSDAELLTPLATGDRAPAKKLGAGQPDWRVELVRGADATKARLGRLLGGDDTPALLFTAGHGMGFPSGHPRQLPHQGGLLCQDWPGPEAWRREIPPDFYFSADDVPDGARLGGTVAFLFACYGAGTPRLDDFPHQRLRPPPTIAPHAFVAELPRRLLGHPSGALAVVGHVERAWGCSIVWREAGRQIQMFEDALKALMKGKTVGRATEYANQRYASLSSGLSRILGDVHAGGTHDPYDLAGQWTANNDARSYAVIGDPAVRLPLETPAGAPARPPAEPVRASRVKAAPKGNGAASATKSKKAAPAPSMAPAPAEAPADPPADEPVVTVTVPLHITVRVGGAVSVAVPGAGGPGAVGFAAGVRIDPDYGSREGYDDEFLGPGPLRVALPGLSAAQRADAARVTAPVAGEDPHELKYHHFSVVLSRSRRLARFTAVNIDGRLHRQAELKRATDQWFFDPRVPRAAQAGEELYAANPFDRGHLVRRLDPAWGRSVGVARAANDDTFHWTNCAPQHERFNQGKNLWAGLEDYLLERAAGERKRLTVFTGPVLAADDPEYRGVRVPKRYWKVAAVARPGGKVAALGFVVSQEELLRAVVSFDPAAVARTFQVAVRAVGRATGLDFGPLPDRDAGSVDSFAPGEPEERELGSLADIRLAD